MSLNDRDFLSCACHDTQSGVQESQEREKNEKKKGEERRRTKIESFFAFDFFDCE